MPFRDPFRPVLRQREARLQEIDQTNLRHIGRALGIGGGGLAQVDLILIEGE